MTVGNTRFFKTDEGIIFLIGLLLFFIVILFFSFSQLIEIELLKKILPMVVLDILAGRGASICFGLGAGMSHILVAVVSVLFNIIWLFIFYPLFVHFYAKMIEIKIIGRAIRSTRNMAEKNRGKVERFGALGLSVIVWVPFTMTGSLVGAILGYLIGMRTRVILLVVFISMTVSSFSWAFGFEYMFGLAEKVGTFVPAVLITIILGAILFFRWRKLKKRKKFIDSSANKKKR